MVVDTDTAAQPLVRQRLFAEPGKLAMLPTAFNVAKTHNATSKRGSVASRPTWPSTALISPSQDFRSSVQTAAQTSRTGWSASSRPSSDAEGRISTWSRIGRRSRGLPAGIDWAAWAGEGGSGKLSGPKRGKCHDAPLATSGATRPVTPNQCMILNREYYTKSTPTPKKSQSRSERRQWEAVVGPGCPEI